MEYAKPISNSIRKLVASLQRRRDREESGLFVAEGEKLCDELLRSRYSPEFIVLRSEPGETALKIAERYDERGRDVYIASNKHFDQLCDTKSPQDILAVIRIRELPRLSESSFIAFDGIADPGNLGTIIRTADWFGITRIILNSASVDQFNPKTVRATMGSIFRCTTLMVPDLADYLERHCSDFQLYGAALDADMDINDCKPKGKFGIVFGNEANGISPEVMKVLKHKFIIPGGGGAESLNVAVSVGISCYHFSKMRNNNQ